MTPTWEVWDRDTGNLVGDYADEEKALRLVAEYGDPDWIVVRVDGDEITTVTHEDGGE